MTRADIEEMLRNLAETTRYLRESSRRMREAAEHMVTVADHLQEIGTRTDAAITAGLTHLHGDEETVAQLQQLVRELQADIRALRDRLNRNGGPSS